MAEGKTARQLVCTMCPFDKAYVLLLFLLISLIGSRTARRSLCAAILRLGVLRLAILRSKILRLESKLWIFFIGNFPLSALGSELKHTSGSA